MEHYEDKVKEEASIQIQNQRNKLQKEYESKKDAIYGLTIGLLVYSLLATALTACLSERFLNDLLQFVIVFFKGIFSILDFAAVSAGYVWLLKDIIPFDYIDVIVAGMLAVIVFVMLSGVVFGGVYFVFYKFYLFYKKEFCDWISLVVSLISMAVLVWFADTLSFISLNLVVVWMLVQAFYLIVRMALTTSKSRL